MYLCTPRLFDELRLRHADGSFRKRLAAIAKVDLVLIDDFAISPIGPQWPIFQLQGRVDYCNSTTRLLAVSSQPEERGTIAMTAALLNQVDIAHLRGFKITPASAPDRIRSP